MVNEVVKPVVGGRILDVMEDCFQNVHAESSRRQFLIKSGVNYSLENRNDSSKFVRVRGDLSNGPVDAEVKTGLNFECLDFFANVVNHLVQLMQVLLMELDDVCEKISFFCFWVSMAVSSLEICTVLYVDNVRAEVAAMNEAMSHCRLCCSGTCGRLAKRS